MAQYIIQIIISALSSLIFLKNAEKCLWKGENENRNFRYFWGVLDVDWTLDKLLIELGFRTWHYPNSYLTAMFYNHDQQNKKWVIEQHSN